MRRGKESLMITKKTLSSYEYSVLMSVYKEDKVSQLKLAIDSMLNQTLLPEQFVIVEDGKLPEEMENLIIQYEKIYPKVFTIVKIDKNSGLGNALNHGIYACRNELIARMDADDISKPERCQKQIEAYRKNPKLDILGTQIDEFIKNPNTVISQRIVPCSNQDIQKFAKRNSPFNHPTVMYRKSVVEQFGGYMTYGRKEDLDLFIRMVNGGCIAENLEESLLWYRTGADNLKRRKTWINCKEAIQIMWKFYKKGYIGIIDMLYVVFGQLSMFIFPLCITKILTRSFLRKGNRK